MHELIKLEELCLLMWLYSMWSSVFGSITWSPYSVVDHIIPSKQPSDGETVGYLKLPEPKYNWESLSSVTIIFLHDPSSSVCDELYMVSFDQSRFLPTEISICQIYDLLTTS